MLFAASQDKDSVPSESSQVRVGKWKIPSSQDYLPLFKSLLDCDQLKVQLCNNFHFPPSLADIVTLLNQLGHLFCVENVSHVLLKLYNKQYI